MNIALSLAGLRKKLNFQSAFKGSIFLGKLIVGATNVERSSTNFALV